MFKSSEILPSVEGLSDRDAWNGVMGLLGYSRTIKALLFANARRIEFHHAGKVIVVKDRDAWRTKPTKEGAAS